MKKLIAVLLVLSMLLSLSCMSFAADNSLTVPQKTVHLVSTALFMKNLLEGTVIDRLERLIKGVNYVALGDSTAMGFYVGDFTYSYQHNSGDNPPSSEYSEYAMFKEYLSKKYPYAKINATDLTLPGMRPIQLRGILDQYEHNRLMARTGEIEDTGYKEHLDVYTNIDSTYENKAINPYDGYRDIHKTFTSKIKAADVITYDMLMIDSSLNLITNLSSVASATEPTKKFTSLLLAEGYPKIALQAAVLKFALDSILSDYEDLPLTTINNIIDYLLYTYATISINFSKNMDWIYRNNPDVDLIVVAPTNSLSSIAVNLNGVEINVGRLLDCLLDAVTLYLVKGDSHANQYHLADCSDANEIILGAYAKGYLSDDGDYAKVWDYIKQNNLAGEILDEDDYAIIRENIANACNAFLFQPLEDLSALTGAVGAGDINAALYHGIAKMHDYYDIVPSLSDETALAFVLISECLGAGFHPSAEACEQKGDAIIAAYESSHTADEFYLVRMTNFALNTVGAVLGNEKSQAAVTSVLTKIFTPIIDLSALKTAQ